MFLRVRERPGPWEREQPCPRSARVHPMGARPSPSAPTQTLLIHLAGTLLLLWAVIPAAGAAPQTPQENPPSSPLYLTPCGDQLFFSADDGRHGREVWVWEATAGDGNPAGRARMLADLCPGPAGSEPVGFFCAEGWFYVNAMTQEKSRRQLWLWDPAEAKFRAVFDRASGGPAWEPDTVAMVRGMLYFTVVLAGRSRQIAMVAPGTCDGELLSDVEQVTPDMYALLADETIVFAADEGLWHFDPASKQTHCLDKSPGQNFVLPLPNGVFFAPDHPDYGMEPWFSDGAPEGARLVKDIMAGPTSSTFGQLKSWAGAVYFNPDDGAHGSELWKSDGTAEGTLLIKDINEGPASSDPHYFAAASDALYFVASDLEHGQELWRSDGRPEGTVLVKDLHPGAQGTDIWSLTEFGTRLYFCASTAASGEEVFLTDGTGPGTHVLLDIAPGPENSGPNHLAAMGELLFFTCNDLVHGEELWRTDGTPEGTFLVADIALPRYNPSSRPRQLTALEERVLFTVDDLEHGKELWKSDGTEAGTMLLCDIASGAAGGAPTELTRAGAQVFFAAEAPASGRELWHSDGTPEGTRLLKDIRPGPAGSSPELLHPFGTTLYFAADDGEHGRELWRSDGTEEGTMLVHDITPGQTGAGIQRVFDLWGKPYFYAQAGAGLTTLWRIEDDGPRVALEIQDLFVSAGLDLVLTKETTVRVLSPAQEARGDELLVPVIYPPSSTSGHSAPASIDGLTFFAARTRVHGAELWKTDGTLHGTRLLCDAFPGPPSSGPAQLLCVQDTLYFVAEEPRLGRVVWKTSPPYQAARVVSAYRAGFRLGEISPDSLLASEDGLVISSFSPINPYSLKPHLGFIGHAKDSNSYEPLYTLPAAGDKRMHELTLTGSRLFFTADDGLHGEELWIKELQATARSAAPAHLVKDIVAYGDFVPLSR
ncbi:MAG: hypothetical protein HYV26_22735 [Candidatus Hydrogenedentes bacterium]|nr:hypothetical protein [Candidatus Hydrogenedentota bacterium]